MDARQVLPDLPITTKAAGLGKPDLELGKKGRRQRGLFARGFFDGQQAPQPSRFIEPQPSLDGMPMDRHQFGKRQPRGSLATGQEVESLQAGALFRVRFGSELGL